MALEVQNFLNFCDPEGGELCPLGDGGGCYSWAEWEAGFNGAKFFVRVDAAVVQCTLIKRPAMVQSQSEKNGKNDFPYLHHWRIRVIGFILVQKKYGLKMAKSQNLKKFSFPFNYFIFSLIYFFNLIFFEPYFIF